AGDLKAKYITWNSRRNNTRGTALFNFTSGRNVEVLGPNEPTHHGGIGQPDVLDIVIVKDLALEAHLDVVNDLSSDHLPVLLRLGRGRENEIEPVKEIINWDLFTGSLINT